MYMKYKEREKERKGTEEECSNKLNVTLYYRT